MDTLILTYETFRSDIVTVWVGRVMLILLGLVITTFVTMTAKNLYSMTHNWVKTLSAVPNQLNELIKQLSKLNNTFNKHREDDEQWKEKVEDKFMKVEEEMAMKDNWWGRKFDKINSEVKTNKTITDAQHASTKGKLSNIIKLATDANTKIDKIIVHHNFHHKEDKI